MVEFKGEASISDKGACEVRQQKLQETQVEYGNMCFPL